MAIETAQQLGVDRYNIRKPERVRVMLTTRMRVTNQPDMDVEVHNISNRGFMGETPAGMPIATDVLLFLPGIGWVLATIRWSAGTRFGGRFSEAINLRQFWRANPPRRLRESAALSSAA